MNDRIFKRSKFLITATIFFIAIILLMTNPADNRKSGNERSIKEAEIETINSFPADYRKMKDSIDGINNWKVSRLRGIGEGISSIFIGVSKIVECDSFDSRNFNASYKTKYFACLDGYTLKEDASFIIHNEKYYVQYSVWDHTEKNGDKSGHSETKEISVRYSTGFNNAGRDSSLLIPVSQKTYTFLKVLTYVLFILFILLSIYLLIILPARTLYSIATGAPFTKQNIRRLYIIGWTLLVSVILPPLIAVITEWILGRTVPSEIYYPFFQSIIDHRPLLIAGLIVLLMANAFRRGYKLQEEQDLTV